MQFQQLHLDRQDPVRYLNWGIRFFLAAALTAARLPSGTAPFALGWVAAAGAGGDGMAALAGTGLGAVLFLSFDRGLPHLAVAVLLVTTATALQGLRVLQRPWAVPAVAAAVFFTVDMAYVLQAASPLSRLTDCLVGTALTGAAARVYGALPAPGREAPSPDAPVFLLSSLLLALTEPEIGGVSPGRGLLCALLVTVGWRDSPVRGMTTGLWAGLLADLCAGTGTLFYTAAYGLLGLLAGWRSGCGRLWAAAVCAAGALALMIPVTEPWGVSLVEEAVAGCAVFVLIPARAFGGKRLLRREPAEDRSDSPEGLKRRLSQAAAAFRDLYDTLGRTAPDGSTENPAVIFDRAAEKVCRGCALCELCWKKEYVSTFNALNDATPFLLERGRSLPKDYPAHFTGRCIHLTEFLTAVDGETSAFLLRRQYRKQVEDARRSARGQYAQMGELLSATAADLGAAVPAAGERLPYRIGAALQPKEGESVCGDSVSSFETDTGRLCLLLSDGSGSGESARRESALTNRLLRQFLEAGVEPLAALKTLNAALALRSQETGSFATIDLLTVELGDGDAALYKYGAAPTYVKKGGSVRRITGHALPPGLRDGQAAPDVTRLRLERGAFTVMVSDGVADALGDEWLQDLLAGWEGTDPQALAGLVMAEAARRGSRQDDCGVQVLYLPEGKRQV